MPQPPPPEAAAQVATGGRVARAKGPRRLGRRWLARLRVRRARSLAGRTALGVALGVAAVLGLYGFWVTEHERNVLLDSRRALNAVMLASTAETVAAPMWDFDEAKVNAALWALAADPDFVAAWVVDARGHRFAATEAAPQPGSVLPPPFTGEVIQAPVNYREGDTVERLGTVYIAVSHARIAADIRMARLRHAAVSLVVLCALLAVLFVLARRALRPLRRLRRAIELLSAGSLDTPLPRLAEHSELRAVGEAIEGFRREAIAARDLRLERDRLASRERVRVHAAVESAQSGVVILDEDGVPVSFNRAAKVLVGGLDQMAPPEMARRFGEMALLEGRQAMIERRPIEIETTDADTGRSLTVRLSPIHDGEGDFLGTTAFFTDVSERVAAQRQIERMANEDPLTGLPNRRRFDEAITSVAERAVPAALLMLDLDRFKSINDTLGHPVGDELLRLVGRRLGNCVGEHDMVARLGGDEFAVLITGAAAAERARRAARAIIAKLAEPFEIDGARIPSGTSIGVAVRAEGVEPPDELVRRADVALYKAKAAERGTFRFHEARDDRALRRTQQLEQDLRAAIENDAITLDYQPQRCLETGRTIGFEALARWRPPAGDPVSPGEFIPIAEEAGLIDALTERCLVKAARVARALADAGRAERVSVNLSPVLFARDPVAMVAEACRQTGCDPSRLEIEVTEALFLSATEANKRVLARVRDLGARVALDDFGTGFSSLSTLIAFPIDAIKVDRAFVSRLDGADEHAQAVVRAIIELGHALGMSVTAEGIETPMQLQALRALGCDVAQGFLIGRPAPDAHGLGDAPVTEPEAPPSDEGGTQRPSPARLRVA